MGMTTITQTLGALGSLITISTLIPQIIKMWRTKSVGDLSIVTMIIQNLCVAVWLAYGLLSNNIPLVVVNSVMIANTGLMIILKLKYSNPDPSVATKKYE